MPTRIPSRAVLVLVALCASACATPVAKPEPTRKPFLPYQLAPQPYQRDSGSNVALGARPPTPAKHAKDEPPPLRIDAALIRFAVEQRQARYSLKRGTVMPPVVLSGWSEILEEIDKLLREPATRTLPLEVVRARVALDAEIDLDREHYLSMPDGLAAGVKARSMALDYRLGEVRRLGKKARPPLQRLAWPLDPVIVTSLFGMRADPFHGEDRDHQGVDLKARTGQLIQAAAGGVVTRAGRAGGHGLHVQIEHDNGITTCYSHLSTILVTEGMQVPPGGPVGLAGTTGRSTGPHLNFEVWREGEPVDPLGELPDPAVEDLSDQAIGDGG
ncbi:MAG: M23 family metallopeptidase [Deltaproteobacteria bacterium]|nr:M23 family metallopeptidase [Deltaproteobacteria bacterium]